MLRHSKSTCLTTVCLSLASLVLAGAATAADRPNILFIFSDDHAPHAIGAYDGWLKSGQPDSRTSIVLAAQGESCSATAFAPTRSVVPVAP